MSLIEKVKKVVPTASDPEPKANLSAADFEDADVDGDGDGQRDSEGSSSSDGDADQSGRDGEDQSDGTTDSPDGNHDGAQQPDGSADGQSSDAEQDGSEQGQEPPQSGSGGDDGNPDGEPGDADAGDGDGDIDQGDDEESDAGPDGSGQSSLFDYEDPEAWEDGDESGDSDGTDNSEGENDAESPDSDAGDEDGESDVGDGESRESDDSDVSPGSDSQDDLGDESQTEDGAETGTDSDHTNDNSNSDTTDDGNSDGQPGEDGPESPDQTGEEESETPNSDDSTDSDGSGQDSDDEMEIEPDNGDSPTPPGVGEDPYEPHPDLIENESDRLDQEERELQQELHEAEQELKQFMEAMSGDESGDGAAGGGLGEVQFNIDPDGTTNSPRWSDAKQSYKRVARLLAKQLKESRRDSWNRGQRSGQLDSKRLHGIPAKRLDVMKRRNPGDKKKYAVIIVLDRSGSMNGKEIELAEAAIARFALAMQGLDIDVCIIDMHNNTPRIISPFGVDVESCKGDLMSKQTGGGTPLSDAIVLARERMRRSSKHPILISVTDGRPNDPDRYMDELSECYMPVMGITVDPKASTATRSAAVATDGGQSRFYDVHTTVGSQEELERQLEKMTLQITF